MNGSLYVILQEFNCLLFVCKNIMVLCQGQTQGIFKMKQENLLWICYEIATYIDYRLQNYVVIRIIKFNAFFHTKFTKTFLSQVRSWTLFCYETKIILGPAQEIK